MGEIGPPPLPLVYISLLPDPTDFEVPLNDLVPLLKYFLLRVFFMLPTGEVCKYAVVHWYNYRKELGAGFLEGFNKPKITRMILREKKCLSIITIK